MDSDNPDTPEAWWTAAQAAETEGGYFGPWWTYVSSTCATWPGRDPGRYAGPFTAATANPVLVVGNYFDPATPHEGALTVAELLPNSRLVSLNGWGHVSLFFSQDMDRAVARYLLDGTMPAEGTVFDQDEIPFVDIGPSIARSSAAQTRASLMVELVPDVPTRPSPREGK